MAAAFQQPPSAVDANTMDIDMDIDLGLDDDEGAFIEHETPMNIDGDNAQAPQPAQQQSIPDIYTEDITQVPVPEKVHIRGLDNLATEDVDAFAAEHFPAHERTRVEWVDDTSANIVYASVDIATDALVAFSEPSVLADPTASYNLPPRQLRQAKQLASHPNAQLQVRQALTTDVKKARARDASRYYLMNPDKDPSNRPRHGGPRKRRHGEDEQMAQPFDENMYDDDPVSLANRNRRASDNLETRHTKRQRAGTVRDTELFANRVNRNAGRELFRTRSASPRRELFAGASGDGRYGFEPLEEVEEPVKPRGRAAANAGRELFSDNIDGARARSSAAPRELFDAHTTPLKESAGSNSRASSPFHRRTDAFDYDDYTAANSPKLDRPRGLAERITGGPTVSSPSKGRGNRKFDPSEDQGASMRGDMVVENPGFTIKGVAKTMNPRVRELFPQKEGDNAGRELFGKPRRAARRKAEDLFG